MQPEYGLPCSFRKWLVALLCSTFYVSRASMRESHVKCSEIFTTATEKNIWRRHQFILKKMYMEKIKKIRHEIKLMPNGLHEFYVNSNVWRRVQVATLFTCYHLPSTGGGLHRFLRARNLKWRIPFHLWCQTC